MVSFTHYLLFNNYRLNNKMKRFLTCLYVLPLLASCGKTPIIKVPNDGTAASDSSLLCRQDSTITINVGKRLTPHPLSSQFLEKGDSSFYIMLDENRLYWFDKETGNLIKERKIEECGTLNNYSGILCLKDTFFAYNYNRGSVYMLDSLMKVKKSWELLGDTGVAWYSAPEALTNSPIIYSNGSIMLSGTKMGKQEDMNELRVSCRVDLKDGKKEYGVPYPSQYIEANFGGVYFNSICHALNGDGNYIYSFPADHYVYIYSPHFASVKRLYMGSRYASAISSSDMNALQLLRDKDLRIKYFISQDSYSNLLYDKYRKVYYRIANHPLEGWKGGRFVQPFSIIVMDEKGRLITETPVQKDYDSFNLRNMHVTHDGLLIQKETGNENVIEFVVYKLMDGNGNDEE